MSDDVDTNFRIIIIDDNPSIHQDFLKILKTESLSKLDNLTSEIFGKRHEEDYLPNFEIDVASQGKEGVDKINEALKQGKPYSLAFVDIRMPPGWDGIETIEHIWQLDKNIQVVICTAYSDYSWEETVAHLGKTDNLLILKKPFDNISVRQLACALTTKWKLAAESRRNTAMMKQKIADRTMLLQKSLSLVKSTFESSSDGILVVDNNGMIIDYNQKFMTMFNIPKKVLETKSESNVLEYMKDKLENPEGFFNKMHDFHINENEITIDVLKLKNQRVFECYSQPHKLNDKIVGRILDFRDITKRAKLEEELQFQATHDSLTGLENRVKLISDIRSSIVTSEQNKTQFAILFLDFDRFKLINDSLSHVVGDKLLQVASSRLQSVLELNDSIARLGGDEFVILLMDINNKADIEAKIEKILTVFQEPFNVDSRNIILTVSIGISIFPKDGKSVDILLRNADVAMYRAKANKGNDYQFYVPEMSIQSLAELDQEVELRHAIHANEFSIVYQPQIDLGDEKIVAVEALLRWQHPTKGLLLPIDFIPLAEETGLILPISEWVLRTACRQNKAWQDAGYPPIRMAVNVTAQQFKHKDLPKIVQNILKETKLDPKYLELELTENVLLSNSEVIKIVSELKEIGVNIAIDDFGTGYSSLSYLHKIPLDRLKIDASFVQHIKTSTDDEVIIRAVIAMAKNLNLEVLAEGVETAEQLNFLKKYKCEDVQGFYYSKPLTSEQLERVLKDPEKMKIISKSISE